LVFWSSGAELCNCVGGGLDEDCDDTGVVVFGGVGRTRGGRREAAAADDGEGGTAGGGERGIAVLLILNGSGSGCFCFVRSGGRQVSRIYLILAS